MLELFNHDIESDVKIHKYISGSGYSKNKEYVRVLYRSDKLTEDLVKHGVVYHKTDKLKFPTNIVPNDLIRHYIRGYFDGDGSVWKCKNGKIGLSINGTYDFLNTLSDILYSNNIIYKKPKISSEKNTKIIYCIKFGRNSDIENIYHYFYDNSIRYLERKKEKFK